MSTIFSLSMEMSRLTRDETAEVVSRDQIIRHERGQGKLSTSRIGNNTVWIQTLPESADHTCITDSLSLTSESLAMLALPYYEPGL